VFATMRSREDFESVMRLLGGDLSSAEIARRTGVPRATVSNLAPTPLPRAQTPHAAPA